MKIKPKFSIIFFVGTIVVINLSSIIIYQFNSPKMFVIRKVRERRVRGGAPGGPAFGGGFPRSRGGAKKNQKKITKNKTKKQKWPVQHNLYTRPYSIIHTPARTA